MSAQNNVRLFVDYNIITFSSFTNIINFNSANNVKQYIGYDELIPLYLSWKDKNSLEFLKNFLNSKKVKLFKFIEKEKNDDKKLIWYKNKEDELKKTLFKNFLGANFEVELVESNSNFINVFNFKEFKKILDTLNESNFSKVQNFKISLSHFLSENIENYFQIIKNSMNINFSFYIMRDKSFMPSQNDIIEFIDNIYSIQMAERLKENEKKILDVSFLLFKLKFWNNIYDILLNLIPIKNFTTKRYNISSIEYEFEENKFIALLSSDDFLIFDADKGFLKKWIDVKNGEIVINFDSLVENLYLKNEKSIQLVMEKSDYSKFRNGLQFIFYYPENIKLEKNIIFMNNNIFLTYKLYNGSSRKKKFKLEIQNKFSPSLEDMLFKFNSMVMFYETFTKNFKNILSRDANCLINISTLKGIHYNFYNRPDCINVIKGLYNYNLNFNYLISLYPYETKNITFEYKKIKVSKFNDFNYKDIENNFLGECE